LKQQKNANLWLTKSKTLPSWHAKWDMSCDTRRVCYARIRAYMRWEARRAQVWQCLQPRAFTRCKRSTIFLHLNLLFPVFTWRVSIGYHGKKNRLTISHTLQAFLQRHY
jgi:hypothetical protein